jgi:hypothetical protein
MSQSTSEEVAVYNAKPDQALVSKIILSGDLSGLSETDQAKYYVAFCERLKLDPITKPFDIIREKIKVGNVEKEKVSLYPNKSCAEQLREKHNVSVKLTECVVVEGVYRVTAEATKRDDKGNIYRTDEATGAVAMMKEGGSWKKNSDGKSFFEGNGSYTLLDPATRANAMMKAETKAKRRVTFSICGLGGYEENDAPAEREIPSSSLLSDASSLSLPATEPAKTLAGTSRQIANGPTDKMILDKAKAKGWSDWHVAYFLSWKYSGLTSMADMTAAQRSELFNIYLGDADTLAMLQEKQAEATTEGVV